MTAVLACHACGGRFPVAPLVSGCPRCAGAGAVRVLEVAYERAGPPPGLAARGGARGLLRFADLLPGGDPAARVSLGAGDTPLVRSRWIGPRLGLAALHFKNEAANPTWSFKDRYVAVTLDVARSLGFDRAVVASTGNLGASVAAYCAAGGLRCVFLATPDTSRVFLDQARRHGAHAVVTTAEGRHALLEHLALRRGWFPVGLFLPRPVHNPFGIEGYKTIAFELIEALGEAPAAVLFPCARGNGLYGTWKGFREAAAFGWVDRTPAMVACQPVGANSLEVSLRRGLEHAVELPPVPSVALSTRETVASDAALRAIRESGGGACSASDAEILAAVDDLAREGLCVEPSSALPVACLPRALAALRLPPDWPVVCVLTAAGIRWPESLGAGLPAPPRVDPTPEAIDRHLATAGLA